MKHQSILTLEVVSKEGPHKEQEEKGQKGRRRKAPNPSSRFAALSLPPLKNHDLGTTLTPLKALKMNDVCGVWCLMCDV